VAGLDTVLSVLVGQVGERVQTGDPHRDAMLRFLSRLQSSALGSWLGTSRGNLVCRVEHQRPDGHRLLCRNPAASGCGACGQPVCLDHLFAAADGKVLCFGCAERAVAMCRDGERPSNPSAIGAEQDRKRERRKHLRRLKLKGEPTEDAIQAAYRKLAAAAHPDRHPASRRKAAHDEFVFLGQSRDWLLRDLEEREAA
jgi:hypothetical protein